MLKKKLFTLLLCLVLSGCGAAPAAGPQAQSQTALEPQSTAAESLPAESGSESQSQPAQSGSEAQSQPAQSGSGEAESQPAQTGSQTEGSGEAESRPPVPPEGRPAAHAYKAMWVSYLEWQSFDFSSEAAFRAQVDTMMQNCAGLGLNVVIAQVRPFGDALYPSRYYPWSDLCTGVQGGDPGFDPLQQLVESAHSHGLEIEAWVNPYRIRLNERHPQGELADQNLYYRHPDWVKPVNTGLYLDPASEEVRRYVAAGVAEIAENYAVDGIHFDDYFYPTTDEAFDWESYDPTFGSLAEWRRENVNLLVRQCYAAVKDVNPAVRFGISPQGNIENNYNGQYSDVYLWLSTPGYVDYLMPQIYWGYGYTTRSGSTRWAFENISREWQALQKAPSVSLYFGLGAYRIGEGDGGNYNEAQSGWQTGHTLADQARDSLSLAQGYALYRYDFLFKNSAWAEYAAREVQALKEVNAGA